MAKPLPVASTDSPGSSKSTICGRHNTQQPPYRPRHRKHRTAKSSLSSFSPSSGLLVLLASVVSASTANGSPAPPSFLCPSIGSEGVVDHSLEKRAPSSSSLTILPTPSEATNPLSARHVPDRYHQDTDGIWRRVGSYTLYGSTVSACTGTCRQPTNVVSSVDDQIQVSGGVDATNTTTTPSYDIRDSLPPGWKPTEKPYQSRTPLILAMSLVLAFFICFFIISCLFWRKNVKKRHRSNDVEAKAKKKRNTVKEEIAGELVAEKEYKNKQKVWARATARWKASIRFTARQRRGKRFSSRMSQAHQSSLSLENSRSHLAESHSSIRSAASSRRSSTISIPDQLRDGEGPPASPSIPQEQPLTTSSPPQANSSSPPAYQHRGQIPPIIISMDGVPDKEFSPSSNFDNSPTPSHSSNNSASAVTNDGQMVELLPTPLHAAHVATDDKSLLARLADFASSPPVDDNSTFVGPSEARVSAPAWQDEDIEDFALELVPAPGPSSNMFPPPPSKELLAASEFYDYPFTFDEMELMEAEGEPSAPPFEEGVSPPLQDSQFLVPSAPPFIEDDDHNRDIRPSAPEWDPISSGPEQDLSTEIPFGQDHDRLASQSTVLMPTSSSNPTSTAHMPPDGSRPANDSVVLPGYQP